MVAVWCILQSDLSVTLIRLTWQRSWSLACGVSKMLNVSARNWGKRMKAMQIYNAMSEREIALHLVWGGYSKAVPEPGSQTSKGFPCSLSRSLPSSELLQQVTL